MYATQVLQGGNREPPIYSPGHAEACSMSGRSPQLPSGTRLLSRREREIAGLVAEGLTNREIARRLFISERTAEGHVEQIRNKLGFTSRSQVASWATQNLGGTPRAANV